MRDPYDLSTVELPGMGQLIGYARVSTIGQELTLQIDALKREGCTKIFEDVASGAKVDRPGLDAALAYLRSGDTLIVWKLDRLGRSLPHLVHTVESLREQGIGFQSLTEAIDTGTSGGNLVFNLFASLAAFERDLIRERTRAGLKAAAARGRLGGRRPVITPAKLQRAQIMIGKGLTVREAAAVIKVSKTALYEALKATNNGQDE